MLALGLIDANVTRMMVLSDSLLRLQLVRFQRHCSIIALLPDVIRRKFGVCKRACYSSRPGVHR